jgi:hypothetical protein
MPSPLAIGDFSRATHLKIKALRHTTDQIPTAQVTWRFLALDMPLEEIHSAPTPNPGSS